MSATFQVEMLWRCGTPDCNQEMLGRYKKCSKCGKPKDNEPFYDAPGPVTRADAVTDPELLKQAKAGEDWHCHYCGCAERRDSGECKNCGGPSEDSVAVEPAQSARVGRARVEPELKIPLKGRLAASAPWMLCALGIALVVFLIWWAFSPTEYTARVVERQWTHSVSVERYQVVPGEGFHEDQPSEAFDVSYTGARVHHHDRVPDGYRSESYQESYTCGETCYTTPVNCTSNQNGFKTCSGGSRSCSPKTCYRTQYRQVPKYRDEPVYQPWYRWHVWRWKRHRELKESGTGGKVLWPSEAHVALNRNLSVGEKERASRHAEYTVIFAEADGDRYPYHPKTLAEFEALPEGKSQRISVSLANVSLVKEGAR